MRHRGPPLLCGVAAALALGIGLADRDLLPPDAALVLATSALVLAALARSAGLRATCAMLAAAGAGALSLGARLDEAARHRPATPFEVTVEARVASAQRGESGLRVDLIDVQPVRPPIGAQRTPGRLRLRIDADDLPLAHAIADALPGERVRLRVRIRAADGLANPGSESGARALARAGIGAAARLVHPALGVRVQRGDESPPGSTALALRRRLAARLEATGDGGALLAALALGERGAFPPAWSAAFQRLGISHLLSVSGLHLVLAAGAAYAIARSVLARASALAARTDARLAALGVALVAACGYTLLSGGAVPVRRSLVFLIAMALAPLLRRPAHRAAGVAAAALVVLVAEPEALFAAGAQMSFAASAALLASRPLGGPASLRSRMIALLATTAAATAATGPLVATHLGVVQPAGLLANLVAVPWTGAVLMPASFVATLAAALPDGRLGSAVLQAAAWIAAASCQGVARLAEPVPALAVSPTPAPSVIALAIVVALPALRASRLSVRLAAVAASATLLALAPPRALSPPPPRVVFLDVGQGDASLVQGERGALLVDGGGALPGGLDLGARAVVPALHALGVRRLDLVIATHGDLDHRGGLPAVLSALAVTEVWIPFGAATDPAFDRLYTIARQRGVPLRERGLGDPVLRIGDLAVRPLWPPPLATDGPGPARRNDRSLVVAVTLAGRSVLLPGDLESAGEAALVSLGAPLTVDVLKLGHHGSRTSSSSAFLTAAGAQLALASAPCAGRFGMPHREALARAENAGLSVWWTGRDGAVIVGLAPRLVAVGWASPLGRCALPQPQPAR